LIGKKSCLDSCRRYSFVKWKNKEETLRMECAELNRKRNIS
jgi:hypothetical protein